MPDAKIFLDTNVIIYAYDVSAGEKREKAQKILLDLWESGQGLLSIQVLQEFFVNVTQKIPQPLALKTAKQIVDDLLTWEVVVNDGDSILEAIELHLSHKYSFWDSLIIQAAIKGGASLLLSEDLSGGQTLGGITINNPF
jgi:predicted nucleic acid-binding protein